MFTDAIQKFAQEINEKYGLNLNFVVKSNFLDMSYMLKNGEEVLKEHNDVAVILAYMQGIKFVFEQNEKKGD